MSAYMGSVCDLLEVSARLQRTIPTHTHNPYLPPSMVVPAPHIPGYPSQVRVKSTKSTRERVNNQVHCGWLFGRVGLGSVTTFHSLPNRTPPIGGPTSARGAPSTPDMWYRQSNPRGCSNVHLAPSCARRCPSSKKKNRLTLQPSGPYTTSVHRFLLLPLIAVGILFPTSLARTPTRAYTGPEASSDPV